MLEVVQLKAAKGIIGCSQLISNAAVGEELDINSLQTSRDVRSLKWQHNL